MTSTGYCRDQDAVVCQVGRGKTVKALEDDHGKLELSSQPKTLSSVETIAVDRTLPHVCITVTQLAVRQSSDRKYLLRRIEKY